MADLPASRRIRRIQRIALVLLTVGGVINYVDRAALAVGLPWIRRDLGLSLTESGILSSAFLWAYAFSQMPAGALIDRLGARRMLSAGLGLWSLAQTLGGLVANLWQFMAARVLLGAGESPQFPSCVRVVADWFPQRERGSATGVWNCSSTLGTAIGLPMLTFFMLHLGWRRMFAVMGLFGLAVALVIHWLYRDPGQTSSLTPAERQYLADDHPERPRVSWRAWKSLFRFRTVWGMIGGFCGANYCIWIYTAWLPQYLEIQFHVTVANSGWIGSIPFLCGAAGSIITGRICDRLLRRGFPPIASRKIPMIVSLLGVALFTLLASRASSALGAIACISASLFLLYGAVCAGWTMATAVAPVAYAASIGSIQNFFGYLAAASAPTITGFIAARTGSFQPALLFGALVALLGAIVHLVLVGKPLSLPEDSLSGRAE
jgi:sugar phosphate permease